MATSPFPQWAHEMSPTHRGPTGAGVLRLAVLALIVAIAWQFSTGTDSGARQVDRKEGINFCEEHRGRPGWAEVCARHGYP
jgi:hypothetical protein